MGVLNVFGNSSRDLVERRSWHFGIDNTPFLLQRMRDAATRGIARSMRFGSSIIFLCDRAPISTSSPLHFFHPSSSAIGLDRVRGCALVPRLVCSNTREAEAECPACRHWVQNARKKSNSIAWLKVLPLCSLSVIEFGGFFVASTSIRTFGPGIWFLEMVWYHFERCSHCCCNFWNYRCIPWFKGQIWKWCPYFEVKNRWWVESEFRGVDGIGWEWCQKPNKDHLSDFASFSISNLKMIQPLGWNDVLQGAFKRLVRLWTTSLPGNLLPMKNPSRENPQPRDIGASASSSSNTLFSMCMLGCGRMRLAFSGFIPSRKLPLFASHGDVEGCPKLIPWTNECLVSKQISSEAPTISLPIGCIGTIWC